MKRLKRFLSLGLTLTMLVTLLAACGSNSDKKTETANDSTGTQTKKLEPVTLKLLLAGEQPKGWEEVVKEFENRTRDTLNAKLDAEFNILTDHKEKIKVKMAAGEDLDIVFDATFVNLRTFAADGAYAELDNYFNNDKYPGLKKAFAPAVVEGNKFLGHNYTMPFYQTWSSSDGIYIRKDLREKYSSKKIETLDDLKAFYDKILENEKGMVPFATDGSRGWFRTFEPLVIPPDSNLYTASAGVMFYFQLDSTGKKVVNLATLGDPKELTKDYPSPWNDLSYKYKMAFEWRKYMEKDSINQKDKNSLFTSGKAATVEGTLDGYMSLLTKLKAGIPNATMEFWPIQKEIREMKEGFLSTSYWANNSVAFPKTSKKLERSMLFFDWLFSDQKNHDLFEYGIEGKNWIAVGNDKFKYPDGMTTANNYFASFSGWSLTWNPNYVRFSTDMPEDVVQLNKYYMNDSTYRKSAMTGFTFDQTPVKNEIAKIQSVWGDRNKLLANGIVETSVDADIAKMYAKEKEMGLETIRAEMKKQLEAFFASKK